MRQILSVISLLFLVSCGGAFDHIEIESDEYKGTGEVDLELRPLLNQFSLDFSITIPDFLSVRVVETLENINDSNVDAVCWSYQGVGQKVEIKKSRWDSLEEAGKEQLLYHELGHCVMNKGHDFGYHWGSESRWCPVSIMNPYTFTLWQIQTCYIPDHAEYLEELNS